MTKIWQRNLSPYDFRQLIDKRILNKDATSASQQIICDIDKTYLETHFESVFKLVKIPFEDANDKITVNGANAVLAACRWSKANIDNSLPPIGLHFVSSSPPQLRPVLTEKLTSDDLDWDSDSFKNQAYNLKKGRMDQLNQHVIYKSAAIIDIMRQSQPNTEFVLIGDNAEMDAFIYMGILLYTRGLLSTSGYQHFVELAGVKKSIATDFAHSLAEISHVHITAILIRKAPGYEFVEFQPFTNMIHKFEDFFQCALILGYLNFLEASKLPSLARDFHNVHNLSLEKIYCHCLPFLPNLTQPSSLQKNIDLIISEISSLGGERPSDFPCTYRLPSVTDFKELPAEESILEQANIWVKKIHLT